MPDYVQRHLVFYLVYDSNDLKDKIKISLFFVFDTLVRLSGFQKILLVSRLEFATKITAIDSNSIIARFRKY